MVVDAIVNVIVNVIVDAIVNVIVNVIVDAIVNVIVDVIVDASRRSSALRCGIILPCLYHLFFNLS